MLAKTRTIIAITMTANLVGKVEGIINQFLYSQRVNKDVSFINPS